MTERRTIASFDVGVKNLAFCVMSHDPEAADGARYPIQCWNCFDLTDADGVSELICSGKKKNGDSCANVAKVLVAPNEGYCGVHNPDKKKYKAKKKKKVSNFSYEQLGDALWTRLEQFDDQWKQCEHVIIEQQFCKNRKMIFISAILFSYFLQKKRDDDYAVQRVKFASARNKLNVYDGPEITERKRKNAKEHRKWLAIQYCEHMIREDEENLAFFHRYARKRDDLSDCFLQGADYLKHDCRAVVRKKRKAKKKKK